jgi:hypothetical protein
MGGNSPARVTVYRGAPRTPPGTLGHLVPIQPTLPLLLIRSLSECLAHVAGGGVLFNSRGVLGHEFVGVLGHVVREQLFDLRDRLNL